MTMNDRCPVCGGATTCPEGKYRNVRAAVEDVDTRTIPRHAPVPEGWGVSHLRKHSKIIVRDRDEEGRELHICGSADCWRIQAHYGIEPLWIGQCKYAFYSDPDPRRE